MALTRASVGGRISSAIINAIIDLLELVPYTIMGSPVVATGVSGAGTALSTRGKVTLTAATAPAIDGVFTSAYERYVIEIDGVASTNAAFTFNFRVGGADSSAAVYDSTDLLGRNSVTASATAVAGTTWSISGAASTLHKIKIELSYPAIAQASTAICTALGATNPAVAGVNNGILLKALTHRASAAYDGFKITLSAGTFTGAIRVTGLNNNV